LLGRDPSGRPATPGRARAARAATAKTRTGDPKTGGRGRGRAPVDASERKVRNRTIVALGILALVNAYVFVWRDGGSLTDLPGLGAAAIGDDDGGPLPPLADPPAQACGGDPVRIFEGLENLVALSTTLAGGTTLRLGLMHLGTPGDEIDVVEAAVRNHVDLSLLGGSGAPLRIAVDRFGGVHALEIELAEGHILQACRDGERLDVRNIQHPLRTDVEVVNVELGRDADLASAVLDAGEKPELADLVARSLVHDVDFMTEARPGDRAQVMVEKRWLGRRFHRYGSVLAVRFVGAAARAAYFRYKPEGGAAAYFDADGEPMRRARLRSPIGFHRVDVEARGLLPPSIEVVQGRIGAVYRVPEGAPVVALGDGVVESVDRTSSDGLVLELRLDDGTRVRYAHLLRTIGELGAGIAVVQGQTVALAGHTGRTPHDRVRLELLEEHEGAWDHVDPLIALGRDAARPQPVGAPIPAAQKERYASDIGPWVRALKLAR
jgi:murein DD-endopeptidase MepM/ murein hydrolase activator NlpD